MPDGYKPAKIIEGLAPHIGKPDNTLDGFHVFTSIDLHSTEDWRKKTLEALA